MEKIERGFQGVWIPKEIWENRDFSMTEKCLLIEIESLSKLEKGCFASNQTLAEHLGLSKGTIANIVSNLSKKGYVSITLTYHPGTKNVDKRFIKLTDKFKFVKSGIDINTYPIHEKMKRVFTKKLIPHSQKNEEGIHEKVKVTNNTITKSINKTTTTKESSSSSYDFLENKEFSRLDIPTKKNISKLKNLTYENFKNIYDTVIILEKNKKVKNFNAYVYYALKENWNIIEKSISKKNIMKKSEQQPNEIFIKKVVTLQEYKLLEEEHLKTIPTHMRDFIKEIFIKNFEIRQ